METALWSTDTLHPVYTVSSEITICFAADIKSSVLSSLLCLYAYDAAKLTCGHVGEDEY